MATAVGVFWGTPNVMDMQGMLVLREFVSLSVFGDE